MSAGSLVNSTSCDTLSGREATPAPSGGVGEGKRSVAVAYWLCVGVLSVFVGCLYFTGLEYHPHYSGAAIQAIEPDDFQRDEYMSPNRPIMVSLLYKAIIPMVGPIWLDDRFLAFLNVGMALASLIGLDRILLLFGIKSHGQRLLLLAIACVYHPLINNIGFIANPFEVNPTSFAKPLSIWMVYLALADRKPWQWGLLGLVLAAVSIKNAWMQWLICLVVYIGRFRPRTQWLLYGGAAAAALVGLLAGHALLAPTTTDADLLWNAIRAREASELDPFWEILRGEWIGTVGFVLLGLACLRVRLPDAVAEQRVRAIAAMTLVVWFFGGLYYNWAPEIIRIPHLLPFAVARSTWLFQVLAYAAIGSWALWRRPNAGNLATVAAIAVMMALGLSQKQLALWAILLVAFSAGWGLVRSRWMGQAIVRTWSRLCWVRDFALANPAEFILRPAMLIFILAFSTYSFAINWPAYGTLLKTGVKGDNGMTARWIGVAEFLHRETPVDATVLAMCRARDGYSRCDLRVIPPEEQPAPDDLVVDGAIRSRSGRASPAPGLDGKYFLSYQRRLEMGERWRTLNRLGRAWKAHDASEVRRCMNAIGGMSDYVVVPASEADWVRDGLPYRQLATICGYAILEHWKE